jgi:hypothetical protein
MNILTPIVLLVIKRLKGLARLRFFGVVPS